VRDIKVKFGISLFVGKEINESIVNDKIRMYKKWKIKMDKKDRFYFL